MSIHLRFFYHICLIFIATPAAMAGEIMGIILIFSGIGDVVNGNPFNQPLYLLSFVGLGVVYIFIRLCGYFYRKGIAFYPYSEKYLSLRDQHERTRKRLLFVIPQIIIAVFFLALLFSALTESGAFLALVPVCYLGIHAYMWKNWGDHSTRLFFQSSASCS